MNPMLIERVGWVLIHSLWQFAAVAVLVSVAHCVLRRSSAAVRYGVLVGAMGLMIVGPVVTWVWQSTTVQVTNLENSIAMVPERELPSVIEKATVLGASPAPVRVTDTLPPPQPTETPPPVERNSFSRPNWFELPAASLQPWLAWIVAGWSLGVVLFSARPLLGWYTLRRLRRVGITSVSNELLATMHRVSQRLGLQRAVQLSQSTLAQVPIVVGYFKPVILLPISLVTSLPAGQLEAILAHELAHIRRHDFVVNLLQTLIETLFFYHPAVWWLSRRIRVEREHSCDDLVVTLLGNRVEYGRALVAIEQLRGRSTVLALGVHDGSLLDRVRRIVGFTPDSDVSSLAGRWPIALLSVLCLGMPLMLLTSWNLAADRADQDWGTESNGLRCRLIAVPTTVNDESPDITKSASEFARGDDVTFAVELQNVSDQPLTLIGVRHDAKGQPAFEGKLAPEFFAPHLFEFEFKTADGQSVLRPSRVFIEISHLLSGALTHEIAPGKSLVVSLRPSKFNVPMDYPLASGNYHAKVTYRGPRESGIEFFQKQFPNGPHAKAWAGKTVSNDVTFTVTEDPEMPKPPQLVWGEVKDGLQAAVEFRPLPNASPRNDPPGTFPTKPQVATVFHVKNVSDHAINFVSETGRQLDMVTATNEAGETKRLEGAFFTGEPIVVRWTLKPGEVAELHALTAGIGLLDQPGKYTLRYSINFGSLGTAERESEFGFPKKDDWQQVLVAGDVPVTIRRADHEETLKSLETAPMHECRAVIKKFDEAGEVKLAAMARERLANRWKTIVEQPVASFLRELPKKSPNEEVEIDGGPLIGVQTDLDGVWSNGKGTADNWEDWIVRKQNDYRVGRLHMLFEAAAGYRKVEDAASAKRVLQAGLKGHEIYDMELQTLIGKYWPIANDEPEKSLGPAAEAWTLANYLGELSSAEQALGELDQAIVTHSRFTLVHFMLSWKHPSALPTRHARELWSLLRQQPQSTVPLFWFNFVDEQQPLRKFDLTGAGKKGQPLSYHHENLAAKAPHEFAKLTITAKTRGRKGILDCYRINAEGKHESIVVLQPSADGESSETLTKTFDVPAGTSLVQFMVAGEDFQVGEMTVEAKFTKPDSSTETSPPLGLEFLKPYPKLHGLSLDMTEARLKAIVRAGQLAAQSTLSDGGKRRYAIPTGDQHVVVVMFDNGNCTSIQRIRGENGPLKVTFDSLSVTFKNTHGTRQAEQIDIQANGDCVYHIDELPARGEIAKQPEARLTCKIDPQRMLEFERLLAETNWLTRDRSETQSPPLHSDETPLTVVREGVATTVKCLAPRDDTYRTLLWLLRGIATQEHFVYKLDWVGGDATNRKLALIDIRFGIEALEERPGRALPFFDFDYRRLLPTFARMLQNPSQEEDEVLTAIKVAAFVRSGDDFEFIARLKHDRNPNVRNTVAIAIADYGGERAIPILVEMVSSSEEARWGLIRLGDLAVPAIVKLIESGSSADDIVSEQMVRAYLDHRKELSAQIDDRVIAAARQALEKTKERSQRTQYFIEFLQLAEELANVKVNVEAGTLSGLEFLKPYPKLHGLSLDMSESQFLEIVKQQELNARKIGEGDMTAYRIGLGDGLTLIVMFREDGTCRGLQRVRGEDEPLRDEREEETWGPEHHGLQTRLIVAPTKLSLGWPFRATCEVKNVGSVARTINPQGADYHRGLDVIGPDGKLCEFLHGPVSTFANDIEIKPGESRKLFENIEISSLFLIPSAGEYTLRLNGGDKAKVGPIHDGLAPIPPPSDVKVTLKEGKLPPIQTLFLKLRPLAPKDWSVHLRGLAIHFTGPGPSKLAPVGTEPTAVQLWFAKTEFSETDEKARFAQHPNEKFPQLTRLGMTPFGFGHLSATGPALKDWPQCIEAIRTVAVVKLPVEVRLIGGPKAEPLSNVKVEFTAGNGNDRLSFGTFTTDEGGWLKATLPAEFYELHLKSEKEWPYLPYEKYWTGNRGRHAPPLNVFVTDKKADAVESRRTRESSDRSLTTPAGSSGRTIEVEKWLGGYRRDNGFEPATNEHPARITFTLEPAVELVLRAVDVETGKGLSDAAFYEEVADGEDWAHSVYGQNLGSKFAYDSNAEREPMSLTDNDGYLRRWVGEKGDESKFGVWKAPTGYELVEPKAELSVLTELGQARAEQVFKFRRIRWAVRLEPEKKKVTLGEPLTLTFIVKNATNEPRGLELGGDDRNRLGRPESFEVTVINNEAKKMPVPDAGPTRGGMSSNVLLKPEGETKVELKLADWATITQPGNYRVFVKRTLKLFPIKAQQGDRIEWGDQPEVAKVAAGCEFEVIAPAAAVIDANAEPKAEGKQSSPQPTTAPPGGLEFLKPYPKLHGLSLDMTEPQFLEIVKQQELETRKTVEDEKATHRIALGDGHTLIVSFDKDGKCSGIQRVRDEEKNPPESFSLVELDPPPVVGDFSKVNDPDELLDSLAKSQLPSLVPQTGGGFYHRPGTPPQAMFITIWEDQFTADDKLDPRIRRLIELGERALPSVHQRLNGLTASDLLAPHLTLVLRSTEATESVPVLIKLLKTTPDVVLDGTEGLEDSIRGFRAAVTQIAATSALWKLTGRKHAFTTDQWEKWWQSVKPEFVVLRERQTPEYALRITPQRINDLVKELSTNEVAAREKLIVIGPPVLPHLFELPALAVMLRERGNTQQSDASLKRLAWVIDELGATEKLPAKLRRDYFTQRFEDEGKNVTESPILEQALCRALNHCSFADFCHICLKADGHLPDKYGSRLRDWMHLNPQVFSRRLNKKPAFDWGERSYSGFRNDVTPAADPAAEIAGAVPVIDAGLSDKEPRVRYCAAKLADIVGLCSQEKPEPLIEALRDHWLTESDANIRLDIGIAMTRFSTPLVMESISKGLRSDRVEILSDAVALMSDLPLALNDATRPDFDLLVQFTRHENDQLRRRAVSSLRFKAPLLLAPEFDRLVTDKVEDIRKECAYALRNRPDPKFADVLFKLADDPNEQVRIEALSSIGNLHHPASMERLLPHLRDNKVHGYAVAALASMGGKDALPLMMSELEAGNDVGGMVYQHLRRLTDEGFEEKPEPWLEWWKKNKPAPAPDKDSAANTPRDSRIVEEPQPKPLTKEEHAAAEKRADSIFERTHQIETLDDPGPFINELLTALKDPHRRVRQMAGQALAHGAHVWNGNLRIVDGLIAAIKVEREVDALHQLVQAAGSYRDARAVDPLIDVVNRPEIFSMSSETLRSELEPKEVRDRDEAIRIQVAMALAEIGDRKANPFLRNLLSPERPMVMEALGKMQDRESVPVFLEALKPPAQWTESTIRLAVSAARALKHVPDEQAFEPMHTLMIDISRLLTERDPFVELRAALCEAISVQANAGAATVLLQFTRQLENESRFGGFHGDANEQEFEDDNLGQHPAYWPLFHMQAIALPALIAELQAVPQSDRDETRRSRELAAAVLSNIISQGDLQPSDTLSAVPTLIAALEDRSPLVRQFAARSLGLLHSKEAVPALVKLVDEPRHSSDLISASNRQQRAKYKARSNFVLESVANALSWIGDERAAAAAEKLLKHKAPNVRAAAVFATLSSRHPQTVELLTPLTADENLKVREAAVRQLGFTKNALAVAPLIKELKSDDDPSLRATAAQSLGLLGDRSAGDALASALDGEPVEPNVRRNAAVALIQLNDDRGLDAFRAMLTDPKGSTRAESVQHLTHVAMFTEYLGRPNWEHPPAREALLKALTTDTDARVRSWGLGALQGINSADALGALRTLARDTSEWVRSNALSQLADSSEPTRSELLVAALEDPHAKVRGMAASKLKSFNTPASIAALTKALDDTDPAVREVAMTSLIELKAALGAKAKLETLSENDPSPKVQYRAQQVLKGL